MTPRLAIAVALAVSATPVLQASAATPFTPGPASLAQALADGRHHVWPTHVQCQSAAPDEPTEFRCAYRLPDGARCSTWVAIDGATWILIDTPQCRRARR